MKSTEELRAAGRLAVLATTGVTDVVEEMHRTIARVPLGLFYGPVRGITQLVGAGLDAALSLLGALSGERALGPRREAVLSLLNGVLGDYLGETGNPLAIQMSFRQGGGALPLDAGGLREVLAHAGGKLLVLVHGSAMNDRQWSRNGHDHGAALARDLGYTPVYLHYNTGLHISTNGRALAELLEKLVQVWPVAVDEISFVGHSMGGLVARSACHVAAAENLGWRAKLRRLVCLGSPHHGSPIERGGSWIHALLDLSAYSRPIGRLARIRGAGVTDMRFGNVLDEHWAGRDRFARADDARCDLTLPDGVDCFAIAGTRAKTMAEKLPGDGLVPVHSALGRHERRDLTLPFPEAHQWIALGTRHLDLLDRPEVYAQLRDWFAA